MKWFGNSDASKSQYAYYNRMWGEKGGSNLYATTYYLEVLRMESYKRLFSSAEAMNQFIQNQASGFWTSKDSSPAFLTTQLFAGGIYMYQGGQTASYYPEVGNSIKYWSQYRNSQGRILASDHLIPYSITTPTGSIDMILSHAPGNRLEREHLLSYMRKDVDGELIPSENDIFSRVSGNGFTRSAFQRFKVYDANSKFCYPDKFIQAKINDQGLLSDRLVFTGEVIDRTIPTYLNPKFSQDLALILKCIPRDGLILGYHDWKKVMLYNDGKMLTGHMTPLNTLQGKNLLNSIMLSSPFGYIETLKKLNTPIIYELLIPDYLSWWDPVNHKPGSPPNPSNPTDLVNNLGPGEKQLVAEWLQKCNGIDPFTRTIKEFKWTIDTYDKDGVVTHHDMTIDMRMYYFMAVNAFADIVDSPEFAALLISMRPTLEFFVPTTVTNPLQPSDFVDYMFRILDHYTGSQYVVSIPHPIQIINDFY